MANGSKLQSHGTVKLTIYPDLTEYRTHQSINFKLTFHLSDTKINILGGTALLEKSVETFHLTHNRSNIIMKPKF